MLGNIFQQREKIVVAVAVAIVFIFSLYRLPESPATWFDEGINAGIAQSLVQDGVYSLRVGPGEHVAQRPFLITTNYPVLLPVAASLALGGMELGAARVSQVIFLWLFCYLAYRFARAHYGAWPAAATLLLIVTFAPFYGNGKAVLGEVPGLVFFLGGLLMAQEARDWRRLVGAGVLLGLAVATKPFFLVVGPAVLAAEVWHYWRDRKTLGRRVGFLAFGGIVPVAAWLATVIVPFTPGRVGEMIGYYSNSYAATDLGQQVITNVVRFFTESTPVHFLVLAAGSAWLLARRWRARELSASEMALVVFCLLNWLWYLKTPGWYRYFFTAHVLLMLVFPAAVCQLFQRKKIIAAIVLAALIVFQLAHAVSRRTDPLYVSDDAGRFTQLVAREVADSQPLLVVNSPSLAFLLAGRPVEQYLQINPVLSFTSSRVRSGQFPEYVAVAGDPGVSGPPGLAVQLADRYEVAARVGHYTLYARKKI